MERNAGRLTERKLSVWHALPNSYLGLVELVTDTDTPSGRSSEQCILLSNDLNSLNTM